MTELFVTGARILELGRRLLATPPLAELPAAYDALLRDPGELLEAAWGAVAHGEPAAEEPAASRAARAERVSGGAPSLPSRSAAFAPNALLFPDRPAATGSPGPQTPSAGTKAVPLRLTEERPQARTPSAFAPATKDESRASSPLRQGTAPGLLPLELVRDEQATQESVEEYSPEPLEGEQTKKFVEWPAARPAAGAALAAPGNVRQKMEERLEADPELQILRGQLGEDEGKRERLQTERARETFREGVTEERQTGDDSAGLSVGLPAAQTPTSFSPLASLLSKNVSRTETAPAPLVPEVLREGGGSLWSSPGEKEGRSVAERAGGERTDDTGRRASVPTVDEVLEELYERLRLEFSRTYGTTGG